MTSGGLSCPAWSRPRASACLWVLMLPLLASGCVSKPPQRPGELCAIFAEKPGWHRSAQRMERKWKIPVPIAMAFVHRESSYKARAKPPRTRFLGFIPGPRPSSAYGFAQATDPTWREYVKDAGSMLSDRDDFGDAIDFIGWYNDRSHRGLGIARNDAYRLYVAYYAGPGGYKAGKWRRNKTIKRYASIVSDRAARYGAQYRRCSRAPKRFLFF